MISSLLGDWCIDRSLELDHIYISRNCIIRVMCFTKILCHDLDSPNAPKGVSHDMGTASSSGPCQ